MWNKGKACTVGGDVNWYSHRSKHCAAAKSRQSCPTLCNPIDSKPGANARDLISQGPVRITESAQLF